MSQGVTTDTEQYISNKSFDETFQIEIAEGVGYDSASGVLRPIACDANGYLKVSPQ